VICEEAPQYSGVAREFVARLDAIETQLACLGEAGVERDVAAQFRQIVIAPPDRADAQADGHLIGAFHCFLC
jgi:hypothetical protein